MKEIKFRVWNGEEMSDSIKLGFAHGLRLVSTTDLGFDKTSDDKCILMQYTTIKDKNGKEIYDGDIVRTIVGQNTRIQVVKYDRFAYFITDNYIKEFLDATGQAHEVIGNLFENPELI